MVEGGYENQTLLFSGSRSITLKEIADKVSSLLGRNVQLVVSTEEDYVRANLGKNGPRGEEEFLRKWATTYKALARGELDVVDPLLQKIVGRELKPFEATLKEMLGLAGSLAPSRVLPVQTSAAATPPTTTVSATATASSAPSPPACSAPAQATTSSRLSRRPAGLRLRRKSPSPAFVALTSVADRAYRHRV
ncbi:hypothetical protein NUW54_g12458 [Trametes sanguinea]|uniref:Uncharacterized protein n=1 Tax=Trametes sanguinea TaxID=158606 RepID=A0ACC1MZ31_9APHY|nr:hypothetical protein NUW54_g12458 [Trametes sanguinea]